MDNWLFFAVVGLSLVMVGGVVVVMVAAHREAHRSDRLKTNKDNSWDEFI